MMERPRDRKDGGEKATGAQALDLLPPPTAVHESELSTETNDVQLPPLSNRSDSQPTNNLFRAEIPNSEDFSESSGEVYAQVCELPMAEGTSKGGVENSTGSIGIESPERDPEFEGVASGRPCKNLNQVKDPIPLLNMDASAPRHRDQAKTALATKLPVSIIGAPNVEPADRQQSFNATKTTTKAPQAPPSLPTGSRQPNGEKTADEIATRDDGMPEDDKDTEIAEVPAAGPDFQTASASSEEAILGKKQPSNISGLVYDQDVPNADTIIDDDNIEESVESSIVLQRRNVSGHPSNLLTNIPPASERATEADNSSTPPASPKGRSTKLIEIQPSSPSIQDSIDSSKLSSPEKEAALVALGSIMEDVPDISKSPNDIPSSPPNLKESQASNSRKSTPTASFSTPEGSQSKDILMVELKAMKIASIQARTAALKAEIATKRAKLEEVTKDLQKPAEETVKRHIKLLHDYNDIRDVGQGLVGMIADNRGVRIGELYEEFGVGLKD